MNSLKWSSARAGLLWVLVIAALIVGSVAAYTYMGRPVPMGESETIGQTTAEGIACSALIVIGTVEQVEDTGDTVRVRGRVEEWLKPTKEARHFKFVTRDPTLEGKNPLQPGQRVLAFVPANKNLALDTFEGRSIKHMRKVVRRSLPKASRIRCPDEWRTRGPL